MSIQLTLAARYLAGRRLRALLTTLAVVFGVLVIFGMNILVPTMLQAFQSTMMAAADHVDMTATLKSGGAFTAAMLDGVRGVPGVRAAQGILGRVVNLPADFFDHDPSRPDRVTVISLIGLDVASARAMRAYTVKDGRFLQDTDRDSVVISATLADGLGLKVGSALPIPTGRGLTSLTVAGIRTPRAQPGNEELLVTLPEAQALLGSPGMITSVEANVEAADQAGRERVEAAVMSRLGESFTMETLSASSNMYASLQAAQIAFTAFAALALFMGAFIIFNTFRTVVAERRRDIGMLRAIGASRRTIIGTFLMEGLLQGVAGTVVGLFLGYLLAAASVAAISPMLGQFVHISLGLPKVPVALTIVSVVLGVGVTLAAGLFPALSAGRLTPMETLRPSTDQASYRRAVGTSAIVGIVLAGLSLLALFSGNVGLLALGAVVFMVGLILLAPALVRPLALGFGALLALLAREGTGTLARGNMARNPSRAAVTASTTMIALALIVALGGMTVSVSEGFLGIMKKSLGSDYLLVPPSVAVWQNDVGAEGSLADRLRAIPGVGQLSTLRYAGAVADLKAAGAKGAAPGGSGVTVSLIGIDPVQFPQVSSLAFTQGSADQAYKDLGAGRGIIVNPVLATSAGVKLGDTIPFQTPDGRREYRVAGIATDFMNAKIATAFVSQACLAGDFHKSEDVFIQLNLARGADAAGTAAAIKAAAAEFPQFSLIEGRAYYREMSALFRSVFAALYVLFAFLALPSLLTTINTLAIGVIERTREIGMLRAVGSTRRQVSRMILAEALLLAAFGTAFGLAAGLYLGYLLVRAMGSAGFPVVYLFPWGGIVAAVAIGLLFGALASVVPARKASKMAVVEALRYE
jgi:putative ABC transport system permease protein